MTQLAHSFLMVSQEVSFPHIRFPIFGAATHTQISGNFQPNIATRAVMQGFLLRKLFQGRKPQVSSWFPVWFPPGG